MGSNLREKKKRLRRFCNGENLNKLLSCTMADYNQASPQEISDDDLEQLAWDSEMEL